MTWTTIPDGDIDPDSPVTTGLMTALRDNVEAALVADSGAPKIVEDAHTAITAGSSYRYSFEENEVTTPNAAYTKIIPDIVIQRSGTYQFVFDMKATGVGTSVEARVYRNASTGYSGDAAFGTEQTTSSLTYVTKTESLAVNAGDIISLYAKKSGFTSVEVIDFRIESAIKQHG